MPTDLINVLFICGKNRWRSQTAEQMFAGHPDIACASASLSHDVDVAVTGELLEWAELIFVMEPEHKDKLSDRFKDHLRGKRVVCLGILDHYKYMDPALVKLLRIKVPPHLPGGGQVY
ncbi:MAG: low molecular weight protein tyrosine phosphatase family protein [Hylemonella sp.]|uniref:low molecular weight protein tyrosine phosphatase family protein n=1 Tax=Hylemonella sp. TaxID=2066020 RepID=UPI003918A451